MDAVEKKPRRWRKRTIALTALTVALILGILVNVLVDRSRQHNIFDEVYWNTKENYDGTSPRILKIQGISAPSYREGVGDAAGPSYYCKTRCLDQGGRDVRIYFATEITDNQSFGIAFTHQFTPETSLRLVARYDVTSRTVYRSFYAPDLDRFESPEQAQAYLAEHGLTTEDLDAAYEQFINDFFLTQWTEVYLSRYSPQDYGDIEVKDWNTE